MENFPYIALIAWTYFPSIDHIRLKIRKNNFHFPLFNYIFISMENVNSQKVKIKKKFKPDPKLKLMDQVRHVLRYHHYAYRTEKTYSEWILRYIKFFGCKKHPRDMGKSEIEAFLSSLAVRENVSASTQRQALNAIIFLYRDVLDIAVYEEIEHIKAKRRPCLPVVMTQDEVKRVLNQMQGTHLLMAPVIWQRVAINGMYPFAS